MDTATSRRDFLRTSLTAAAAAGLAAEAVDAAAAPDQGRRPKAAPRAPLAEGDPVRVAVIGTGGMGTAHCEALLALAGRGLARVHIAALADVCQPRLEKAKGIVEAAQGGEVAAVTDYVPLLERPDVHGVLIASPEHWHARMCEDAIRAGKDVYVEKPMTLNLADALRLRKVVRANPQVMFTVGTQYVFTPSYDAARQLIADGAIGTPVWSQTSYCRNSKAGEWTYYEIDPAWRPGVNIDWKRWCGPLGEVPWNPEIYARWRRYRKYSTGIIGDLLVHQITPLIRALDLGWPTRVVATGGHHVDKAMENPDQVNITVQFGDAHTMVVAGSTCNELGFEKVIRGNKANIYVGGSTATLRPERLYADEVEERQIPPLAEDVEVQDQLRLDWLEAIRTRRAPRSDVELGTKVMVIVDLATRSIWEGGAFAFDPRTMTVRKI
jgi:predicted dehydrogenase